VRRVSLLALTLALLVCGRPAQAFEVETLRQSGPPDTRFNIAVMGDGYRLEDQTKLKTDAQDITDYLFEVSPLRQYAKFFNVRLIHVISVQDGADDGSAGGLRETALNSYFNCGGIERLLCVDTGVAQSIAADDMPEFNFILVIVNDTKYGGSGGVVCAASANEQSFEVVAHEVGHSLARLADEYSYDGGIGPCDEQQDCYEANATMRSQREQVKWKAWIEQSTPVPTPQTSQYQSLVGLFEGGRYQETGTYRPFMSCKMRDLGSELCSVCQEQFVRSFWSFENVQMIESATPAEASVQLDSCEPVLLSVTSPPITPSTYRYTWTVDGKMLPETSGALQLQPAVLMKGSHDVDVLVEDATELVRHDADGLLKEEHSWSLTVLRDDCVATTGGGGASALAGAAGVGGLGAGGVAGAAAGGASAGLAGGPSGAAGAVALAGAASGGVATTPPASLPPPRDAAGCGCSVPVSSSRTAAPLALLAFGWLTSWRRRSGEPQHARKRCAS
jgi:MYXO-CTERM domain-containing protein